MKLSKAIGVVLFTMLLCFLAFGQEVQPSDKKQDTKTEALGSTPSSVKAETNSQEKLNQVKPAQLPGKAKKKVFLSKGGKNQTFKMDEARVIGFLENPQAVYILDFANSDMSPIKLERSFSEYILVNIDKETFQRLYDDKLKPEL